jgi:two-component system, OmpR family, response regulator CpxR
MMEPEVVDAVARPDGQERADGGGEKIRVLIIEDDQDLAVALLERLRRRGFAADAVFDGEEALNRIAGASYDVLLVDLMLPGADGLHVIRRAQARSPGLQAVVLTGHATEAWRTQSATCGVEVFLEKPTDIATLCSAIRAAVERERARVQQEEGAI